MTEALERIQSIKSQIYKLESLILKEFSLDNLKRTRHRRLYRILECVCDGFNLSIEDMVGQSKRKDRIIARRTFTDIARKDGYPHTQIAQAINKDHSTVQYYIRTDFVHIRSQFPEYELCIRESYKQYLLIDFVTPEQSSPATVGPVLTGPNTEEE